MAVCNLFKELTKPTGNFLVFSQYTDDMVRFAVEHDAYTIEPSSFAAFDINYSGLASNPKLKEDTINGRIPEMLQNYFENACAFLKNDATVAWNPELSAQILMRTLKDFGLITIGQAGGDKFINELKYQGDIDIQSYTENNGMGFGEIYCYIPNNANAKRYLYVYSDDEGNFRDNEKGYIEGWTRQELEDRGLIDGTINNPSRYIFSPILTPTGAVIHQEDTSYKFNTIVVYYNVVQYNNDGATRNVIYKNVPYGIYITGLWDNEKSAISNEVVKYTGSDEIFGEGTSYGLRICSKFVVLPDGALKVFNVNTNTENYSAFAQAMSKMAESQAKMDEILKELQAYKSAISSQLAEFKNARVNVPYIVNIGGENYWFVNGRNLGVKTDSHKLYHGFGNNTDGGIDQAVLSQRIKDIEDIINRLTISFTARTSVFPLNERANVVLDWVIKRGDVEVNPTSITSMVLQYKDANHNDWTTRLSIEDKTTRQITVQADIPTNYRLVVMIGTQEYISSTVSISFASSSYLGYIDESEHHEGTVIASSLEAKFKAGKGTWDNLNPSDNCIQILYPKEFGAAKSIYDTINNQEYLPDFWCTETTKDGVAYYVYTLKHNVEANNMVLKFS